MTLSDREAAEMKMQAAVGRAHGTMSRHMARGGTNPAMAFRQALHEALPTLKKELIELAAEIPGVGDAPLRDEISNLISSRLLAFLASNQAGQRGRHAVATAHEAVRQGSACGPDFVARAIDLAVYERNQRSVGSRPASTVTLVMLS